MSDKIAVVTGSNKGIGYAIVKELCKGNVGVVYLTARDPERGHEAVDTLKKEGLHPLFHQLDVTNKDSVKFFADHIKQKHGGFDILINNAGVGPEDFLNTTYEDAKRVIDVNFYSVITVQDYLFPLLRENGRVVNISSSCGHMSNLRNEHWISVLSSDDLKHQDVYNFVDWYLDSVANGKVEKKDFYQTAILAYRISKIALSAFTKLQQRNIDRNISINSLHPGFIKTAMTGGAGDMSIDEASKTPAYLALDAPQSLKGAYVWCDSTVVDWTDAKSDHHFDFFESFGITL